jgi:hypothetical protein
MRSNAPWLALDWSNAFMGAIVVFLRGSLNGPRANNSGCTTRRIRRAMSTKETRLSTLWLSFPLAVLVAVAAWAGLFWFPIYAQETAIWAAEGQGGDAATLVVVVPILLGSATLALRGSVSARLVWMGTLIFLLYNFAVYAMAVHFNALFLVYCGGLSFSFYAFLGSLSSLSPSEIASIYGPRAPVKTMAAVLFLLAVVFAAQWLREIIPALLSGHAPKSVTDAGLLTSPVHVLDLSIVLPGFVITAIALLRRKPVAFVLAPALIVFGILMIVAVAGMIGALIFKGLANDYVVAAVLAGMGAGLAVLLVRYLRV